MCGLAGFATRGGVDQRLLVAMGEAIAHRGPDDHGEWIDAEAGIGFSHRRLAIVDLSVHGHQPMKSADERYMIVFNGEIFNHAAIRQSLDAAGQSPEGGWRGHSDTETLLQSIAARGLEATLDEIVGQFAIALFDRRHRRLTLVRDRFGEKPLYYGWCGRDFVFASELKAIRVHPDFDRSIEPRALPTYVSTATVTGPWSIHRNLFKLLPGCRLDLDLGEGPPARRDDPIPVGTTQTGVRMSRYWDYRDIVLAGAERRITDMDEAIEAIEDSLRTAIAGQSMADVPVGAFLSGGIDSSTTVALYQAVSNRQVKTFTIGFDVAAYDESGHARAVAEHLGTDHHELRVTLREAMDVIPKLPLIWDEPFADSSQIPTYLVSKLARDKVTVALSGDGGDELFGGYNRHILAPRFWNAISRIPAPIRRTLLGAAQGAPDAVLTAFAKAMGTSLPTKGPNKVRKYLRVASQARDFDAVSDSFLDEWWGLPSPLLHAERAADERRSLPDTIDPLTRITFGDAIDYLPDDILVKVDRAGMAVSLEGRIPFLDHRVAAVAARIDPALKVRGGRGKAVLRDLLARHVPRAIIERPKAGFGIPIGEWLRGPLRDWTEHHLDEKALREGGIFDPKIVRARWREHLAGRQDSTPALWSILMFRAWREAQGD